MSTVAARTAALADLQAALARDPTATDWPLLAKRLGALIPQTAKAKKGVEASQWAHYDALHWRRKDYAEPVYFVVRFADGMELRNVQVSGKTGQPPNWGEAWLTAQSYRRGRMRAQQRQKEEAARETWREKEKAAADLYDWDEDTQSAAYWKARGIADAAHDALQAFDSSEYATPHAAIVHMECEGVTCAEVAWTPENKPRVVRRAGRLVDVR